jgi:hypothetical protein
MESLGAKEAALTLVLNALRIRSDDLDLHSFAMRLGDAYFGLPWSAPQAIV